MRSDFAHIPLEEQVAAVQRVWASPIPRLLIFDHCDSDDAEALIDRWRPIMGGCRVLITSRRAVWNVAMGVTTVPLGVLVRDESITLLRSFSQNMTDEEADRIAEAFGDLPLALRLAGSFLASFRDLSVADYLAELHNETISLEGTILTTSPTNYDRHMASIFALSLDRLRTDNPIDTMARALLARAACCAAGVIIPNDLLLATINLTDKVAQRIAQQALTRLGALGLIETHGMGWVIHRLLANFVRSSILEEGAQAAVERAVLKVIPEDLIWQGNTPELMVLQPHLRYCTEQALALNAACDKYSSIFDW